MFLLLMFESSIRWFISKI